MAGADETWIDDYDVVWDSPSRSSAEAMPCGGGGIGLVVWVEDGDLLFYLDRSGWFDENNQLLKAGRVRVRLSPNLLLGSNDFEQRLRLGDGRIEIVARGAAGWARLSLWVEIERPVVHLEIETDTDTMVTASYEGWRTADHPLSTAERDGGLQLLPDRP